MAWLKWAVFEICPAVAASLMHAGPVAQRETKWPRKHRPLPSSVGRDRKVTPGLFANRETVQPFSLALLFILCAPLILLPFDTCCCCWFSNVDVLSAVSPQVPAHTHTHTHTHIHKQYRTKVAASFLTLHIQLLTKKIPFLPSNRSSHSSFPWDSGRLQLGIETRKIQPNCCCKMHNCIGAKASQDGIILCVTALDLFSPHNNNQFVYFFLCNSST